MRDNNLHQDFDIMRIVHTAIDACRDTVGFRSIFTFTHTHTHTHTHTYIYI